MRPIVPVQTEFCSAIVFVSFHGRFGLELFSAGAAGVPGKVLGWNRRSGLDPRIEIIPENTWPGPGGALARLFAADRARQIHWHPGKGKDGKDKGKEGSGKGAGADDAAGPAKGGGKGTGKGKSKSPGKGGNENDDESWGPWGPSKGGKATRNDTPYSYRDAGGM